MLYYGVFQMRPSKVHDNLNIIDEIYPKSIPPKRDNKLSKRANELDGKRWVKYSISVWDDISKSKEELKLNHPAMFPSELPSRLIEIFTNDKMRVVLDPFLGSGSTLIAAKALGKNGIGFEISDEYVNLAEQRLFSQTSFFAKETNQKIIKDDAANLLNYLKKASVDLCITSPPYWDILQQKRTADYKDIKDYSEQERNLGSIRSYPIFLIELKKIFELIFEVLKPYAYCCVVLMDLRKKNKFFPFHSDVASFMVDIGFSFEDIIIWNRKKEYNLLRPLGYPYVFRVNKIHEYILIFRKTKSRS